MYPEEGQRLLTTQAESLYEDMISNIVRQVSLSNISRFRTLKGYVGDEYSDSVINYLFNSSKDIYGQDKLKLKNSETSRYFDCANCGRQIAGGRFAQHVNKCLERKKR